MGATQLLARRYSAAHPQLAAKRLQASPPGEVAVFLSDVEPEAAAAVLHTMWPDAAAAVLDHIEIDHTVRVLEHLDVTTIALILRQCREDARDSIVGALPDLLARRVRHALAVRPGTVGSVVDANITGVRLDASVKDARAHGLDPRLPYLYVVDPEHQLVGVIHRRDLERSDDRASLQSIMRDRLQTVPAGASLAGIAKHEAWSAFDVLPVVGTRGAFLGVIRHKSLRSFPHVSATAHGSQTAVTALLDLGEVYWSGLFSAIEALASAGTADEQGETQ